jgi:hypothetical protein
MAVAGGNATVVMTGGSYAERLVCHARLPLVAGLDSARPAVHVWEFGPGGLREVGIVGVDAADYPAGRALVAGQGRHQATVGGARGIDVHYGWTPHVQSPPPRPEMCRRTHHTEAAQSRIAAPT